MGRLADVAAALARDDLGAVRDALERAWNASPSARIGRLVAAIDAKLPRAPIAAATVAQRERAWLELAANPSSSPEVLTSLLATPWPPHANQCTARIRLLSAWPRSPRIANALLALCERDEIKGRSMHALLRLVVNTLLAQGDPAASELLERVATQGDRGSRNALRATIERRKRPVEPVEEADDVAVLALAEARVAPRARASRDDLLAAIYATPHDDGPREVYADLLALEHDPRGELIIMQLRRARGERGGSLAREAALLRAGGKAYFDGLDRDDAGGITLARGFPARATIFNVPRFTAPAWATIETLVLLRASTFPETPLLRGLRRLCGVPLHLLPLVNLPVPELDFLSIVGAGPLDVPAQLAPRQLGFRYQGGGAGVAAWRTQVREVVAGLAHVPIGRRVTGLAFDGSIDQLPFALEVCESAPQISELVLAPWATEDRAPERWTVRLTGGHLRLVWHGREHLDTFRASALVLSRLLPSQVARVTSVEVVAHAKLLASDIEPTRESLRRIVAAWPSVTNAQILV